MRTTSYLTALGVLDAHDGTALQRDYLTDLARRHRGNRQAMADAAGVSEATIYRVLAAQALEGAAVELHAPRLATVQDLARVTGEETFQVVVQSPQQVTLRAGGRAFYRRTFDEALAAAIKWARAEKAAHEAGGRLV